MKREFPDPQLIQPAAHFILVVLPGVVRVIPVEIHHVVRFEIERFIPETLEEVVVEQSLNVVLAGRDAESRHALLQLDLRVEPRQLPAQFREPFAGKVARLGGELHEFAAQVLIGELAGSAHLSIDIEEELPSRLHLAEQGKNGSPGIRRVVQHAVRDHKIETVIGNRSIHQVGLDHVAINQISGVLEGRVSSIRDIQGNDRTLCALRHEPAVEPGARSTLENKRLAPIEAAQRLDVGYPQLPAIPLEKELLVTALETVSLEAPPLVRERDIRQRLFGRRRGQRGDISCRKAVRFGERRKVRPQSFAKEARHAPGDGKPGVARVPEHPLHDMVTFPPVGFEPKRIVEGTIKIWNQIRPHGYREGQPPLQTIRANYAAPEPAWLRGSLQQAPSPPSKPNSRHQLSRLSIDHMMATLLARPLK